MGGTRGEKVLEDVHLMPRSTCFALTAENAFHSLFLRELQGCLLGRALGRLWGWVTRSTGLRVPICPICGVQWEGGQQRLLEEMDG